MKPEKRQLLEFAVRVMDYQKRAGRLSDAELAGRVSAIAAEWFPADSEALCLIEELLARFEKKREVNGNGKGGP